MGELLILVQILNKSFKYSAMAYRLISLSLESETS